MGDIFKAMLGPFGQLSDIAAALVAFFSEITDFRMWRSLGWLLLGIVLLAGGLILWLLK